ncbi:MAG: hypothetical protein FWB95_01480 [Treponema sp.]|nr:hypothetical protein [Treponema sp.]
MKNKFVIVALIAAILVGGMVLVSCANPDCVGDGKCELTPLNGGQCYWDNDLSIFDCMPGAETKCKC